MNFRAWNNLCKLSPLQKPAVAPPYCYKVNAKLLTLKCKVLCYSASNYLSSLTSCLNGDVAVYPAQASRGKREKKLMCRALVPLIYMKRTFSSSSCGFRSCREAEGGGDRCECEELLEFKPRPQQFGRGCVFSHLRRKAVTGPKILGQGC